MQTQTTNLRHKEKNATLRPYRQQRHPDDMSHHAVTIGWDPDAIYAFWRNLENLPYFMKDLKEVRQLSGGLSHWVVELKSGQKVEWDARITAEHENEMIAWESVEGSEVQTRGSVFFYPAPQGLGTVVSLNIEYDVPGGKLTELLTKFTGEDPETLIRMNLKRLKAYLETGEIPTTEGQSSGREEDAETLH